MRHVLVILLSAVAAASPQGDGATSATPPSPGVSPLQRVPSGPASPTEDVATTPSEPSEPLVPWTGTLAQGFEELRASAGKGQYESARRMADALLAPNSFLRWKEDQRARGGWRRSTIAFAEPFVAWCGFDGLDDRVRSEIWYARGVVNALAKEHEGAEDDFQRARGAAVDRGLSDDALYDVGWLALDVGEIVRATLPEISGKPPAPVPPPLPNASASPGTTPPDPLQVARAAYAKAREHFVERLRSDWRDRDTQANVELCLRRLRELDEIEKKREEEKKKQEQQKKDSQDSKQDPPKDDSKDQKDPKDDPQSKPEDSKDPPKDPKDGEPKPEKKDEPPKDPKDEAKSEPTKQEPRPTEAKEGEMSREEMTQLLDRLQQLEEEARKIQAAIKASRRANVKKDW